MTDPYRTTSAQTRINHEIFTAGGDAPHPAVFARLGVLQPTLASSRPHAFGVSALKNGARGPYVR
jgi:hypothetical protein